MVGRYFLYYTIWTPQYEIFFGVSVYHYYTFFPDIALVKLPRELIPTQHVAPITLNSCVTNNDLISHKITPSGWGKTDKGWVQDLMKGVQEIVKTNAVFKGAKINEKYHLQGKQSPNGVGVCIGDSGGETYTATTYKWS